MKFTRLFIEGRNVTLKEATDIFNCEVTEC